MVAAAVGKGESVGQSGRGSLRLVESSRQIFLSGISLVFTIAFTSFYMQAPGLVGRNGITPAMNVIERPQAKTELAKWVNNPNLLYLSKQFGLSVDEGLDVVCIIGIVLGVLSFASRIMRGSVVYFLMYTLYYSLFQSASRPWLGFQWDLLLLEAGFLAALVAPLNIPLSLSLRAKRHDRIAMFLVKWVLFKLMFMSGIVKLQSRCETWWGLTAMNYHYETQCIPTPLAWFAHKQPSWVSHLSVVGVYLIEIVLPFLFFSPVRSQRKLAGWVQILLMLTIMLTGNYTFFNLLTCVLAVSCFEDRDLPSALQSHDVTLVEENPGKLVVYSRRAFSVFLYTGIAYWTVRLFDLQLTPDYVIKSRITFTQAQFTQFTHVAVILAVVVGCVALLWEVVNAIYGSLVLEKGVGGKVFSLIQTLVFTVIGVVMFSLSVVPIADLTQRDISDVTPQFVTSLYQDTYYYHIANSYGLFRRMTGVDGRPEVVIEGSDSPDGPWAEYHFLYKPGNETQPPPWVAPHQPRLDWQMWFAALSSPEFQPWFDSLLYRLLNGQPEVLALLNQPPDQFRSRPPKHVRAMLYKYAFTTAPSGADWWRRVGKPSVYRKPVAVSSKDMLNHARQHKLDTKPVPRPAENAGFLPKLVHQIRRSVIGVSGEALCWSVVIPIVAMKAGRVFLPKYPLHCFYL